MAPIENASAAISAGKALRGEKPIKECTQAFAKWTYFFAAWEAIHFQDIPSDRRGSYTQSRRESGSSYGFPAASLLFSRTIFIWDFWFASTLISDW